MIKALYGIFCDDVRRELEDKHSLIGLLGPEIAVASFPATLAKLGFASRFEVINEIDNFDAEITAVFPGVEPIRQTQRLSLPASLKSGEKKTGYVNLLLLMSPVPLTRPGNIVIRARIRDRNYRLGHLRVALAQLETVSSRSSKDRRPASRQGTRTEREKARNR